MNYKKINDEIKKFVNERDWDQFHSPKNLSMALSVEASELVEIYQWQKEDEYKKNDLKINNAVKDITDASPQLLCDSESLKLLVVFIISTLISLWISPKVKKFGTKYKFLDKPEYGDYLFKRMK